MRPVGIFTIMTKDKLISKLKTLPQGAIVMYTMNNTLKDIESVNIKEAIDTDGKQSIFVYYHEATGYII